jgi:hypothetical protein
MTILLGYFSDGATQIVDKMFNPTIVPFLPFGQRRIDGGIVIEYLSAARRPNLFSNDEHDGSL